jgi:F0F1-type ATP synthase assembly protein I
LPDKTPDQKDQPRERAQDIMKYSGMAMQMGIIILVGVFAGKKLDEYFQTSPFLMVAMALLSIFAALYSTLKDLL